MIDRGRSGRRKTRGPVLFFDLSLVNARSESGPRAVKEHPRCGQRVVKEWSESSHGVVKEWSKCGQRVVKVWSKSGQSVVKSGQRVVRE